MIELPNITLVCVNGVNPELGVKALRYSSKDIKFAKSILLSHYKPDNIGSDIEFKKIVKLTHETSCLMTLKGLYYVIDTDYCLSIHDDGFIINPQLWTNEFLEYDYIGAPWNGKIVGNGGFCLKSKKFIDLCQQVPWNGEHDDWLVSVTYRDFFEKNGCKFAPFDLALKFAIESKIEGYDYDLNKTFGFHGRGEVYDVHKGEGQQFKDKIALLDSIY